MSDDCPDDTTLAAVPAGRLTPAVLDRLEPHLATCAACGERLGRMATDDPLVRYLRAVPPPVVGAPPAAELVRRLRLSAEYLGVAVGDAVPLALLAPPQSPDEIGRLGAYRIRRLLGGGGMGVVFEADDPSLPRRVALKTLRPELVLDGESRRRFRREAEAMAKMHHPGIVPIHRVDETDGVPCFVMPLLRGRTLEARLREGPLSFADALRVLRETCDGLAAAHAAGLVHGDIKPGNVWLEGPAGRVVLLDFGLAMAPADGETFSAGGTPAYASPEQRDGRPVDARSDLYSLGLVARRVIPAGSPAAAALARLADRLCADDPADRPGSAEEVAELLESLAAGRRRVGTITLGVSAALAALVAVWALLPVAPKADPLVETPPEEVGPPEPPAAPARVDKEVRRFEGHGESVRRVAFSPGGTSALSGSAEGFPGRGRPAHTVRVLDVATGTTVRTFAGINGRVLALSVTPAGDVLASTESVPVRGGPLSGPASALPLRGTVRPVQAAAFSPDGTLGLSARIDGSIQLFATGDGRVMSVLASHTEVVHRIVFSPDGSLAASGGGGRYRKEGGLTRPIDTDVRVWDLRTGRLLARPSPQGGFVWSLAFLAGGRLAVGSTDSTLQLFDLTTGRRLSRWVIHRGGVTSLSATPDGRRLLSAGGDGRLRLWDVESGAEVRAYEGHDGAVYGTDISPDGRFALSGGMDGTVRLWALP